MTNIAIIADSHLIHTYHKNYDKIAEFRRFIDKVMESNPDIILVLGDFFDKKYTNQGRPISHIDGSKSQIPIVDIIKSTGIDWYALLGNHEDENILKALAQAAPNFHYMETDLDKLAKAETTDDLLLETDNAVFWFGNVEIDQLYKKKEKQLRRFAQTAVKYDSGGKENILLLHIDLIPRSDSVGLDTSLIKTLSKSFKYVFIGHEHTYQNQYKKLQNIICVPPSIPTWVAMGRGSVLRFRFTSERKLSKQGSFKDMYGFITLEDNNFTHDFTPFKSTMPTIEIEYDVTGKDLSMIDLDWRKISEALSKILIGKYNIQALVIIPVFTGSMEHLYINAVNHVLRKVSNEMEQIEIVDIREKGSKSELVVSEIGENEILSSEDVFSHTLEQLEFIQNKLKEQKISITDNHLQGIVTKLSALDNEFFHTKGKKNRWEYISEIVGHLLPNFNEILKKSWTGPDILKIISEVRKKG